MRTKTQKSQLGNSWPSIAINILNISIFNALSTGGGPVTAVALCQKISSLDCRKG